MIKKRLSIVIPVYNVEFYLRRCLDHVYNQIDNRCEVVMLDDGSTDNSFEICKEYESKYPSNTRIFHKENEGAGATRNILLDKANGEYVWFVDSDDYIEDNSISKILNIIDKYKTLDILSMCYRCFSNNGYRKMENAPRKEELITGAEYLINKTFSGYLWNKVYNLAFLRNNKIRFNNINSQEDCLFNIRALLVCKRMLLSSLYSYNYFQGNSNSTLHNKSTDSSNRKIKDSILSEKEMLQLKNDISDISLKKAVGKILSLHIAGFLYAVYITNLPIKIINNIIKELKSFNLYPSELSNNRKANIFLLVANLKIVFLFICWFHSNIRHKYNV